jgi:FkbM family methyltransferase
MSTREIVNGGIRFLCDTELEVWRAKSLLTKEPGTLQWLSKIQPGDVLYDIGANVGCYTLIAAKGGARVYAFEPHVANAASLIRNVIANGLSDRVTVLTCAVGRHSGMQRFAYASYVAGSSGHEIGAHGFTELKSTVAIDALLDDHAIAAPMWIKIDIDGQEAEVIAGMSALLAGVRRQPPAGLQVETSPEARAGVIRALDVAGYRLVGRHRTQAGEKSVQHGADPDGITDNAVFERIAA